MEKELLESCKELVEYIEGEREKLMNAFGRNGYLITLPVLEKARGAIAKAEGR